MPGLFDRLQHEIDRRESAAGISAADLLDLPDELRRTVQLLVRRGETGLGDVADALGVGESEARQLMAALEGKGLVAVREVGGEPLYRAYLARRRGREIPLGIWEALSEKIGETDVAPEAEEEADESE